MASDAGDDDSTKAPQQILEDFWENLLTKTPGKVTNIFPPSLYANLLPAPPKPGSARGRNAAESYQAAADECRKRVKQIVRECRDTNERFTDPDFDIESDRQYNKNNCLEGLRNWYYDFEESSSAVDSFELANALATLVQSGILDGDLAIDTSQLSKVLNDSGRRGRQRPSTVHRIDWIFEKPAFTIDGFSSSDVQQGANGNCWFIAAVATICSNPSLMHKICVERDEEVGVYGFVFFRDGEWIWTVVDDNLYVKYPDYDALGDNYDATGAKEKKYKKNNQTGSDALYFASCADQNETWLPLLEKAYAKVHGDYDSIDGGISGEAVEDLTGGVTTKLLTTRILSKDRLWQELLCVNKDFLFSASSPGSYGNDSSSRKGLALNHAYSVLKAIEEEDENGEKHRLVLIRNPWGKRSNSGVGEWSGPWSDGSREWTPYWMNKLNYRFGDDGMFWMSYDDMQKRFDLLDRTRLFDKTWTVVQQWTSVSVAWVTGYLNTKFVVEIQKGGPTIFVLCQLDGRYFQGLEGKYDFDLHFLLQEPGASSGDHIVRARGAWFGNRSISAEANLGPGKYEIIPKIVARKNDGAPEVHDVVQKLADANPQKLRQIGMNYDIANAKGMIELTENMKKVKLEEKTKVDAAKKQELDEAEKERAEFEVWKTEKREREEKVKAEMERLAKSKETKKSAENTFKSTGGEKSAEKKDPELSDKNDSKVSKLDESASDTPSENTLATPGSSQTEPSPANETTNSLQDASRPSASAAPPSSANADGEASAPPDAPTDPKPATTSKQNPWNAVCVLGLRVYSRDPDVAITLVGPKDAEETAVLDADGATQVGATM